MWRYSPSSSVIRFKLTLALCITRLPVAVDPVNAIWRPNEMSKEYFTGYVWMYLVDALMSGHERA